MSSPVIEYTNVTRTFGDVTALAGVTLALGQGELIGMLGPNGAGKSTLLTPASGLRAPSSGTVRLMGRDPRDPVARVRLGTTPQETGLPATLKVGEVIDFVSGHYPDPMSRDEVMEMFGLTDLATRQTGGLSGGQKRRLAVALAVVGKPRVVLLDEPTTGLDVDARHVLWQAVRDYHSSGATVVVTSHYLEEIEALAERVVVIGSGRVIADEPLAQVLKRVAVRQVLVRIPATQSAEDGGVLAGLTASGLVVDHTVDGDRHTLLTADADELVRSLVTQGVAFHDLEVRRASLEEAFLAMTGSTTGAAA